MSTPDDILSASVRKEARTIRQELVTEHLQKVTGILDRNRDAMAAQKRILVDQVPIYIGKKKKSSKKLTTQQPNAAQRFQGTRYPIVERTTGRSQCSSVDAKGTVQRVTYTVIPAVKGIPRYVLWTTVLQNYRVPRLAFLFMFL